MAVPVELSVSNICWPDGQAAHEEAIQTLAQLEVPSIDVAPTKAWPKILTQGPESVTKEDVDDFKRTLQGRKIAGFQSLTYGVDGTIFEGSREDFADLQQRMLGIIDLAALAGAQTIIYGSPKTRIKPAGMEGLRETMRGQEFFGKLAAHAFNRGVILGIEPVSKTWANPAFGQSGEDALHFSNTFNDPDGSFTPPALVPDTFAMADSGESAWTTIYNAARNATLAPHWQIAERGMGQVGGGTDINHREFAAALDDVSTEDTNRFLLTRGNQGSIDFYDGPITVAVEMFPSKTLSVTESVAKAVMFVRANYPVVVQ